MPAPLVPCFHHSQVSDLISKIQTAYVETLEELSWMDDPSKEKAREKVRWPRRGDKHFLYLLHGSSCWHVCSHVGHGDQRTHRLPRSHPAGGQPEAGPRVRPCKSSIKCHSWQREKMTKALVLNFCFLCTLSPKLNFSEELYFENILENLKSEAHKSLKKLREAVDPDL